MQTSEATQQDGLVWWAMSAVFNHSAQAKEFLDGEGAESFVPMRQVVQTLHGRARRKLVPAVANLIFVRATRPEVRRLKAAYPYLQHLVMREGERGIPIIVPDEAMHHFISVCRTLDESLLYFTPDEVDLNRGDRVRVHGGPLDGVVGNFVRVKGTRNRRVVITLPGVTAVAVTVSPDLLEKLG